MIGGGGETHHGFSAARTAIVLSSTSLTRPRLVTCNPPLHRSPLSLPVPSSARPRTRLSGTAGSTTSNSGRASNRGLQQDYTPLSGQGYFETALSVSVRSQAGALSSSDTDDSEDKETFRVYYTPPSAGHLARDSDDDDDDEPVVFVCHHGAGYSAMSFALLAKTLSESSGGKAGVLALDVRGHGEPQRELAVDGGGPGVAGLRQP